eukprot:3514899-Rhodomonas_salina.1
MGDGLGGGGGRGEEGCESRERSEEGGGMREERGGTREERGKRREERGEKREKSAERGERSEERREKRGGDEDLEEALAAAAHAEEFAVVKVPVALHRGCWRFRLVGLRLPRRLRHLQSQDHKLARKFRGNPAAAHNKNKTKDKTKDKDKNPEP